MHWPVREDVEGRQAARPKPKAQFVDYYNNECVREALDNVTPADVYHGHRYEILTVRQLLKMQTLRRRRWYNQGYELKDEELIRPSLIRECVY